MSDNKIKDYVNNFTEKHSTLSGFLLIISIFVIVSMLVDIAPPGQSQLDKGAIKKHKKIYNDMLLKQKQIERQIADSLYKWRSENKGR
ncbi:MAG TPA: hypothetical protein PKJ33_00785 [Alphaproteobacteria bacterium]|nr:hypothetical protein [Alphaproteobacteria bacterium]